MGHIGLAGLLEIGWAIGLEYTHGFIRLWPTVGTAVALLLGLAVRTVPLRTAYAVWTGIGTVGTAILGMVLLGEPVTMLSVALIDLIVCGILGLKAVHWSVESVSEIPRREGIRETSR